MSGTCARSGTVIRKFFLNVSKKEQKRRFLERLEEPEKNWKFSAGDIRERQCWDDYQKAYEEMISNTATEHAPWYVVPADNKWFTRLVVSTVVVDTLESLDLAYPKVEEAKRKELEAAKKILIERSDASRQGDPKSVARKGEHSVCAALCSKPPAGLP